MKYKVLKDFIDKNTHILHEEGDSYECAEKERVEFLQEEGFLEAEKAAVKKDSKKQAPSKKDDK
ncbi:hypothetical protein A374_08754 [Fictibacillus macauensis ZFHKF-1]|uniref:Uncharacterized protein n=1 Tax=Fictibacillus macauensis ZFHKF-1 TaxID=1196324 RepID=I8AJE5_9BACL|nr:hypothetical protein [Fictibacillus macauensis]EIT85912.1 hypothetical protein A374_08754 [Fictibacillus macauensis ZFHKF-1]